jgi:NAD(P)-dependent dehydrogenase (short-subunit alcohol dehydrogenase family)
VANAGVSIGTLTAREDDNEAFRTVLDTNVLGMVHTFQPFLPALAAKKSGKLVGVSSIAGFRGLPGAGAYSASKAAMNQLARVTALEWGKDGIRINSIHPNAVYDTALWTDELLAARAKAYGLSVEQYRKNNLLKTEVSSRDVAELAAEMCGPLFAKTTAAQVPVDGGNERVV